MGLPSRVQQGRSWLGLFDDENVSVTKRPESTKTSGVAIAAMMPITIPTRKSVITRTDSSASSGLQKVRSRCHNPNPRGAFHIEKIDSALGFRGIFWDAGVFTQRKARIGVVVAGRRCCAARVRTIKTAYARRKECSDGWPRREALLVP